MYKEIISEFTYPHNETRESSKCLKPLILEEVMLKDKKLSKSKIRQILSSRNNVTFIDNPYLKYPEVIDQYKKGMN